MAYTTATIIQKDPPGTDARVHLVVEFTGDAGEPAVRRDYYVDTDSTALAGRLWAIGEMARLNNRKTIADNITPPQVINTNPPAPPVPTAFETWRGNVNRLVLLNQMIAAGMNSATAASDKAALVTLVNSQYQAGFSNQL
jgi:hypothetical protein